MVRTHDNATDVGVGQTRKQTLADQEVVDAPPHVLLAGARTVAPPCISLFQIGVYGTESVDKTAVEEFCEFTALFIGETRIAPVGLGVLEVDLLVGHVHVAAYNNRLAAVETAHIVTENRLPLHTVVEACKLCLSVGGIDSHQIIVIHIERDDAALAVVLLNAYTICNRQRFPAGIYRSARIAFAVGEIPV